MCRATPVRRCSSTACCSRALRFSRSPSPRTRWRTRRARCSITPSRRSMTTTAARLSKSRFVTGCQCHKLLWWTVHEPDAVELQPDKGLQDLRSEEHTSELQSQSNLVCRLLLEKKKTKNVRT